MGNALKSLIRINHMQRQLTEKKIKDLRYKKTQIETEISGIQVKMNVAEQTVYEKPTGPHPHMDVLNVLQWKSIQTKKIEILKLAIVDLERQQSTLKNDMCQLIIQKQTFDKALLKEAKSRNLAQEKAQDESNNAIWQQRNRYASK